MKSFEKIGIAAGGSAIAVDTLVALFVLAFLAYMIYSAGKHSQPQPARTA